MEIARLAAATTCGHVRDITRRSEKKVRGKGGELRRELITALPAVNVSQGEEVERTKASKQCASARKVERLRAPRRRWIVRSIDCTAKQRRKATLSETWSLTPRISCASQS